MRTTAKEAIQNEILERQATEGYKMVNINLKPSKSPFEKNGALRKMAGKRPIATGQIIQTLMYWIFGLSLVSLIIWGTLASHGGY